MKVLMITPAVDESRDLLGFIPSWIRKLSEKVDKLYILTLNYDKKILLPENVAVYGLDEKRNRVSKLIYFNRIAFKLVPKVDVVFCHMYPNFTITIAPYAKLFRKPIVTWYTHGHVSRRLKLAHFLADKMVTASKESLRIKSNKIAITGHGIDTDKFKPTANPERKNKNKKTILSVSRISPRKDLETLIKAAGILVNEKNIRSLEFSIVGGVPMASQEQYHEELKRMVRKLELEDYVKFVGYVPHTEIAGRYQGCHVFVSTSQTGSLDKIVLEAMACEKPTLACNEAFEDVFGDYSSTLMFRKNDPNDLADKITHLLQMDENRHDEMCHSLRRIVEKGHSVESLADKLADIFRNVMEPHDTN